MIGKIKKDDLILADGQYYSRNCYETKLNNNVLVVGCPGSGKTRSIVTPNILQASGSYIISDPKGNLYDQYSDYLLSRGYKVMLLNFDEPKCSMHYNFFSYIRSEKDIVKIAHMLMADSNGKFTGQDPFWDRAGEILISSIIAYLWEFRPAEEQTIESILKLVACCQVNESGSDPNSPLERIMGAVGKKNPNSFAYKQYQKFRIGASRTLKSILITAVSKLGRWDFDELNEMMSTDDMDISSIGMQKTAVFVVVSDTDRSMDDLVNLFYTQAINELCYQADHFCQGNRLPLEVRFILDDFATNSKIDEFPRIISSVRSRGISTMLMIQAESQLRQGYGNDADTIIAGCDTYIYLGGNDLDTAEKVARRCNLPVSKILWMPVETSWIFRRGQQPVNAQNFDLDEYLKYMHIRPAEKLAS